MIDLYYWTTPNGHKVSIFLEEAGLDYRIVPVHIGKGEQFQPDFLKIAPNNRIPAIVDTAPTGGGEPISVFESGAILLYLAEKTGRFLSADPRVRIDTLQWLFWQMGGLGPMAGQNHHFTQYAPEVVPYAIERYVKETARLYAVLDRHLADRAFIAGDDYTIADIAIWPWYGAMAKGLLYDAGEFLQVEDYTHVVRWADEIARRPAVRRGRMVNRVTGPLEHQLHERHDASDFDTRTQDKLQEV